MKALNIIGIVLSIFFFPVAVIYLEETSSARWMHYYFIDQNTPYTGRTAEQWTIEAGLIIATLCTFFNILFIHNLRKVNTTTARVFSIMGLIVMVPGLAFNFIMLFNATHISFDEVGGVWILAGLIMTAFTIVLLVQVNRKNHLLKRRLQEDVLDDDII